MKLEILMSCMFQEDASIAERSGLTGDVLIINQCDVDSYCEYPSQNGTFRLLSTRDRGLSKSRNKAISTSRADICMLCDDDEVFVPDYEEKILKAYKSLPDADVIIFKMVNRPATLGNEVTPIKFPKTMKVSSWQISFRRDSITDSLTRFDIHLGAGSGNGAEEELKFLLDCERNGLKIYYCPEEIASVGQQSSTWFKGFNEEFFINRGATTRYILGLPLAVIYAFYYVIRKHSLYKNDISMLKAFCATLKGIKENKISKQVKAERK